MEIGQRFGPGSRVLVAGGAGFVPSHVVDRLIERGATVVAVDNFVTGAKENVAHLDGQPAVHAGRGDLVDGLPDDVEALEGRFDAILHLASPASPTDFRRLALEILRVNSVGTLHLLERAVADGARFLLASTSEAYGDPLVHPQPETYWGNVNPIGVRSSTTSPSASPRPRRWPTTATAVPTSAIVRIFNTYGPRMAHGRRPGHPDVHHPGAAGRAGHRARHRRADPVDLLRRRPGPRHPGRCSTRTETGPVNCGTEHEISMRELAEQIVRLTGSSSPSGVPAARRRTTRSGAGPT